MFGETRQDGFIYLLLVINILTFVVVNEKLSCPADSLPLVLNKTALLQATAHFISSLLLSWVLTSMIGGRYADLIIYCDEQENRYGILLSILFALGFLLCSCDRK